LPLIPFIVAINRISISLDLDVYFNYNEAMYAEIILSKTTPKLDKIYHYKIPADLEKKLSIGHQVLIPFGNRKTIGYVVGFVAQTEVPAAQLKDILGIKTEIPLFKPEALKLAKWMTEYYGCFFISALRAVMPPGTAQKEKRKK